jgi:uncharacterized protein (TIGR00251 family)
LIARSTAIPTTLTVRVTLKPNARDPGVVSDGLGLRVNVKSPPIDGRANAEAAALIASAFGVPKSRVVLARGARSRTKQFRITDPATMPAGFRSD